MRGGAVGSSLRSPERGIRRAKLTQFFQHLQGSQTSEAIVTPDTLTRREAAKLVGVHQDTLSRLLNGVLAPAVLARSGRGGALRLSRPAIEVYVAVQRESRPLDPQQERARRDRAQALIGEQTYAARARELLPADEVARVWSAHIQAVRTKLLSWPATLTDQLHRASRGAGGPAAIERVLVVAIREVLIELSQSKAAASRQPSRAPRPNSTGRKPRKKTSKRRTSGGPGTIR